MPRRHLQRSRASSMSGAFVVTARSLSLAAVDATGRRAQCCLATINLLISAMAFDGFRSFGQASAQFMIVWQR